MYLGRIDGVEFDAFAIVPHGGWGTDFDTIELTAGRLTDPTAAHEVVLPRSTAAAIGVGVGDTITLRTISPDQLLYFFGLDAVEGTGGPAGPTIDLLVVGVGDTLTNEIETVEGMIFATPAFDDRYDATAGHLGGNGVGGMVAVRLRNGRADLPAFEAGAVPPSALTRQATRSAFNPDTRSRTRRRRRSPPLRWARPSSRLRQASPRLSPSAKRSPATSVAVSLTRLCSVPWDCRVETGLRRSPSNSCPSQPLRRCWRPRSPCSAARLTPFGMARRFEPEPGLHVDVDVLLVGAAAVFAIVVLLGGIQAWRATTLAGDQVGRRPTVTASFAERAGVRPTVTTGVRLAFERGHGHRTVPSRSALTAAVLGAAAVIGATAYAASFDRLVTEPARWGWTWDLVVEVDVDRVEEAVAALRGLPEISGVATVSDRQVNVEGQAVRGQSVAVHQGVSPIVVHAGRLPAGNGEIAIGAGLSRQLDREIGDTVTVTTPEGPDQFTVVGRVTSFPLDGDGLGDGVVLAPRTLDSVAASDGFDSLALTATEATSEEQLVEAITPLIDDDMVELGTYGYPAPPDEVVNASSLTAVPWALAAFLGALAVAGAGHGTYTTVRRRRGDLAVLRAVGFRPADLRASSGWHGMCIAAVAIVARHSTGDRRRPSGIPRADRRHRRRGRVRRASDRLDGDLRGHRRDRWCC